jgi:hypothetical protein
MRLGHGIGAPWPLNGGWFPSMSPGGLLPKGRWCSVRKDRALKR